MTASSSQARDTRPLVFINYRKSELRETFIPHLLRSLNDSKVNYFIDDNMERGRPINFLFTKIEESRIAVAIFSKRYPESEWCLDELQKIKELAEAGILKVIPVFVNVTTSNVKNFNGVFGENFEKMRERYAAEPEKVQKWKEVVEYIADISGVVWDDRKWQNIVTQTGTNSDLLVARETALEVKKELLKIDPNYGKIRDLGFGGNLFVSVIVALFCGLFIPRRLFADEKVRIAASWLIGLSVFFLISFMKKPPPVTTPPSP